MSSEILESPPLMSQDILGPQPLVVSQEILGSTPEMSEDVLGRQLSMSQEILWSTPEMSQDILGPQPPVASQEILGSTPEMSQEILGRQLWMSREILDVPPLRLHQESPTWSGDQEETCKSDGFTSEGCNSGAFEEIQLAFDTGSRNEYDGQDRYYYEDEEDANEVCKGTRGRSRRRSSSGSSDVTTFNSESDMTTVEGTFQDSAWELMAIPQQQQQTNTIGYLSQSFASCGLDDNYCEFSYPTIISNLNQVMAARAILICRPNSHPFQDRGVSLEQPVKIGRSVARARPSTNNAIFDCKVLSRNHALLWYEQGKFYLQDTKSSNGTFVNNQRLSKSSEESAPREVCSGDIVQFGVDVMELNKKVTHGCIVATLQLFLPDGKEAKASPSTVLPDKVPTTSVQEIYQLNQYIKEAIQREQLIESKLAAINKLMASTKDAVDSNWKVLISEDRLLTRVDILERQLQASHKTMTDDKLREEVLQLHNDKEKYQIVAKDALRKAAQERMEAIKNMQDLQRNLTNTEEEKAVLKDMFDRNCQELKELVEKFEHCEIKSKELAAEMDQSTSKYKEEVESLNSIIKERDGLIESKQLVIDSLMAKVDIDDSKKVAHNEEDFQEDGEKMNAINSDKDSMSKGGEYPDGNMNVHWENTPEIETLRNQIRTADTERKEILSKLSHLLNIIDDLKAVSNKVQVSEFIQELIHKLDLEIRQIRNFSQVEEPLINNSYSISDEVDEDEQKLENHISQRNSDGCEKLLEESRQVSKSLQADNIILKKENEILNQQITEFAAQIKSYQEQADSLKSENTELQSRVMYLQTNLDSSEQDSSELRIKLDSLLQSSAINESQIEQLKGEVASLKSIVKDRDSTIATLMVQLGDLSNKHQEKASTLIEVACQTLHTLATEDDTRKCNSFITNTSAKGDVILEARDGSLHKVAALKEQLMEVEEELANYKASYNDNAAECATLRRKLADLQSQHEVIHNQSKLGPLHILIPVAIAVVILAILITFHPSS